MGFSLHQLCEGSRVRRALVRSERCDKTAPIVVPQVVGVVVGFGQADADLSQRLTKAGEMEGLGVRDDAIKVENNRCDRLDTVGVGTGYKTGGL
jgi:hypothetical protein